MESRQTDRQYGTIKAIHFHYYSNTGVGVVIKERPALSGRKTWDNFLPGMIKKGFILSPSYAVRALIKECAELEVCRPSKFCY